MKTKLLFTAQLIVSFFVVNAQDSRIWATYYGGAGNNQSHSVATDAFGNVYQAGYTDSIIPDSGGFQNSFGGGNHDAFLIKFDAEGNRLWATFYGGTDSEWGNSVATDALGNVYLAGSTHSSNGIASGGFKSVYSGGGDAFLAKFDANGNRLWATYYGGSAIEYGTSVATDAAGNVYLSGRTSSNSDISSVGFQNAYGGGEDAFLVKFDAAGNRLWATYYGGQDSESQYWDRLAIDPSGNVYLGASTYSTSGIASGGFQNTYGGGGDAFLVKFDASGNRLWATYYGANETDYGFSIAIDAWSNVYLAGLTYNSTGIASGGFQNAYGGGGDAFLVKFDASGNRLWSTYYGGAGSEMAHSVATDAFGNVYLAGETTSLDNIASGGFQDIYGGGTWDAFLAAFSPSGTRLCATYYGGENDEYNEGSTIAIDNSGNVFMGGATSSYFEIASGGFQNTNGGWYDFYLAKFTSCKFSSINESKVLLLSTAYPNPFTSFTTIEVNDQSITAFEFILHDALGREVRRQQVIGSTLTLYREELQSGIYVYTVTAKDKPPARGKVILD